MEKELAVASALTITDVKAQVNLIQHVMEEVMKKDVHFGVIPGCKKPTLYKPGAEKLASTFQIGSDPEIEDLSSDDEVRYRIKIKLFSMNTGNLLGHGIGECSSHEEKYKWKKAVCDEEWEEKSSELRREKWFKGYNNSKPYKVKQIRTEKADIANTILKMAKKRALTDGILTVTAASDIFDQDIEDLPEDLKPETNNPKSDVKPPETKKKVDPKVNIYKQMLEKFGIAKNVLGKEKYYEILGGNGFEHANDISKIAEGNIVLKAMGEFFPKDYKKS